MLVLLSFALVLVATVLLVLGLMSDDGLLLIYLSIGSSVLAAVVLLVALRANRPRQESGRSAPAPLPEPEPEPGSESEPESEVAPAPQPAPALVGAAGAAPSEEPADAGGDEWLAGDQDAWAADDAADGGDWAGEVDFPIADYDTLTTGQILPLLPQLYADEIDVVEERERATKGRAEILAKLDQLRAGGSADPLASYTEPDATDLTAGPAPADEWFPIEDYEALSAAQIRPLLRELDAEELEMVRARELSLGRRQTLLDEIDHLLGGGAGTAPAAEAPTPTPATSEAAPAPAAPARKASSAATGAAKTAPAKKAPAKKAPAKKAPAKKASAKKATSTAKAAAPKAPATKAPAKKASGTEAAAKNTSAARRSSATKASPAKKASPAQKTTAKKATPAKKAAAKKTGTATKAAAKKATAKKATKRS